MANQKLSNSTICARSSRLPQVKTVPSLATRTFQIPGVGIGWYIPCDHAGMKEGGSHRRGTRDVIGPRGCQTWPIRNSSSWPRTNTEWSSHCGHEANPVPARVCCVAQCKYRRRAIAETLRPFATRPH
jgi:hypothetical protein